MIYESLMLMNNLSAYSHPFKSVQEKVSKNFDRYT